MPIVRHAPQNIELKTDRHAVATWAPLFYQDWDVPNSNPPKRTFYRDAQ